MGWLILFVFLGLWGLTCIRFTKPEERLVVFQRGKFVRVAGPGLCFVLFPEEDTQRVKLDDYVFTWRAMSNDAVHREFERIAAEGKIQPPNAGSTG